MGGGGRAIKLIYDGTILGAKTIQKHQLLHLLPTGMKVKSASLFSMSLIILSWPLLRNIPELVRTLHKMIKANAICYILSDDAT